MALTSYAICQCDLSISVPIISNLGMRNTIEKYIKVLHTSGINGWESTGTKFNMWQERNKQVLMYYH